MACICRFQISVKPASCSCSPVPYYILIFLIFQGRVVEDPSITSYTRQNQKQKGAFTLICASSWPRYYLMTLLSSALSKKRQRRPVYAYRRSCLWPYCSTEHTCAFRLDPHEPAGTHPPRPALRSNSRMPDARSEASTQPAQKVLPDVRRARVLFARVRMAYSSTPSHANCYTHKRDWSRPWSEEV